MGRYVCVECRSDNVHDVEFRTDYSHARLISAMNDGTKEISNDDLPYRLSGYYCGDCHAFRSVIEEDETVEVHLYEDTEIEGVLEKILAPENGAREKDYVEVRVLYKHVSNRRWLP